MTGQVLEIRRFVEHLLQVERWRAVAAALSMIAVALSEGLGLLLLIPLLTLVGVGVGPEETTRITWIGDYANRLGVDLTLNTAVLVFVTVISLRQFMTYVSKRCVDVTRVSFVNSLRSKLFAAMGQTEWRIAKAEKIVNMGHILLTDSWRAGDALMHLYRGISASTIILVHAVVALMISPRLAALALLVQCSILLAFGHRIRKARDRGTRVTCVNSAIYEVVSNFLDNLRVAKLSAAENRLQYQFDSALERLGDELNWFNRSTVALESGLQLSAAFAIAAFVLVAVGTFGVTGPALLVVILITARLVPHFSSLSQSLHLLMFHLPAFTKLNEATDVCREHYEDASGAESIRLPKNAVALDEVSILAPDDSNEILLRDIKLSIAVGETVSLDGPSGAGKSTLADVLSGLLPPDHGDLMLDDRLLSQSQRVLWRQHVGYVSQSTALLSGTIRDNLTWLFSSEISDEDIMRVARCTLLEPVLATLPGGLDTSIDRHEGRLSGGERQRIAITREILRQPSLLILDEASNALDLETEAQILANIRRCYPELALLVITHRPESHRLADRTLRLLNGELLTIDTPSAQEVPGLRRNTALEGGRRV